MVGLPSGSTRLARLPLLSYAYCVAPVGAVPHPLLVPQPLVDGPANVQQTWLCASYVLVVTLPFRSGGGHEFGRVPIVKELR